MTLREKFEALISAPPYEKDIARHSAASVHWPGQYVDYEAQLAWELYQAGHAEGIKEAARRCAEIADLCADDGTHAVRRIRAEYPEAFK